MILPPSTIGVLAGISVFLIAMGITRPEGSVFSADSSSGLIQRLDTKLRNAGITSVNGTLILFMMLMGSVIVAAVAFFLSNGNPLFIIISAGAVPVVINMDLDRRASKFQGRLYGALVPFLRKMEAQIRTGVTPTRAFATAAQEDPVISWALREQLSDLSLQAPFSEVLEATRDAMPLRPWLQFVEAMQSFSVSGGGDLADIISTNVQRISSRLLLRQRLMGDLAPYRGQQIILMAFAVGIPALMYIGAASLFGTILSTGAGRIALFFALVVDGIALWMTQSARRDVEKRLEA